MEQEPTVIEPVEEQPTANAESVTTEEVRNPEAVLAKNKELLGTIKGLKNELSEFKTAQEKAREQKLVEDGKYKELLEEKEKQLSDLMGVKERADKYDAYFQSKLEKAKEGLSDVQAKLVEGFNGSLEEKLQMAEELQSSIPQRTSSPGAARPGSNDSPRFDLKDYTGADGNAKLTKLYYENRDLYNEVIKAKNSRL